MAHTEWLPGVQLRHSVPPVQFIHAFVRCLFIYAMHDGCLSIPCTLPVYPYHVRCLFIHAMHLSCLSMLRCCLFTHLMCNGYLSIPYASFLFIHAKDNGCLSHLSCQLSMPCVMVVYPSNPVIYVVHLSCISVVNHPTHQKVVQALLAVSFFCRMVTGQQ